MKNATNHHLALHEDLLERMDKLTEETEQAWRRIIQRKNSIIALAADRIEAMANDDPDPATQSFIENLREAAKT